MKKCILSAIAGAFAMLVFLVVATHLCTAQEQKTKKYEHTDYVSSIVQEDCFVCSSTKGSMGLHWGEDNIGIVNLNTFEVLYLEINRYNDCGELIEEEAGYMLMRGNEDSSVHSFSFPDNAYASVQISNVNYEINRDTIQRYLCQACLDSINEIWFDEDSPAEYAILSFEDRTIRPLVNSCTWFLSGNFGIDCEFKENGDIGLLVHYCLPRYKQKVS